MRIVILKTTTKGATYVNMKPTLRGGTNWDRAIRRKKRLKKNLNWLNSTTGIRVQILYLVFLFLFEEKERGSVLPER